MVSDKALENHAVITGHRIHRKSSDGNKDNQVRTIVDTSIEGRRNDQG